jgi:hypothetical protein
MKIPETETGVALAIGTALGAKEIVIKIFGPSADYLGDNLKGLTQSGCENFGRILKAALRRLGSKIEQLGGVSPRILKQVFEHGFFCEDELLAEYYGGVLAASRSGISRDDRGVTVATRLAIMSTYQIRAHYVIYEAFRTLFAGNRANIGKSSILEKLVLYIPTDSFDRLMAFDENENSGILTSHTLNGLISMGLIRGATWGSINEIRKNHKISVPKPGIAIRAKAVGIELFQWAHGAGNSVTRDLLKRKFESPNMVDLSLELKHMKSFDKNV